MSDNKDLLEPSAGDLSIQMMDRLLGPGWHDFSVGMLDASSGAILPELFSTVNTMLIAVVSAMMVWQITIGSMETARTGTPLGRQMHSVFAPMRAPISLFLLAPIAKGYSILQVLLLIATYYGVGMADTIWSRFIDYIPERDGVLVESSAYKQNALDEVEAALRNEVNYLVIAHKSDVPLTPFWSWDGNDYGGTWTYGTQLSKLMDEGQRYKTPIIAADGFGTISVRCGAGRLSSSWSGIKAKIDGIWSRSFGKEPAAAPNPPASQTAVCTAMQDAITDMVMSLRPIALNILDQYESNAPALSTNRIVDVVDAYDRALVRARALAGEERFDAFKGEIEGFARTAKDLGWASSAFYWWTLTSINEQSQVLLHPTVPEFKPGDDGALRAMTDGAYKDYQAVVDGWMKRLTSLSIGTGRTGRTDAGSGEKGNLAEEWAANTFLYSLPRKLSEGNPLVGMADVGHTMITYGSVSLGIGGVAALADKIPGASFISGLGSGIGTVLLVEGAVLAYVIPMMPALLMVLAIIGWMVLVIEMLVAGPLLAAAHAFSDGQDFAPPQTRHGYSVAIGATMRPLLLTFGFIFAWLLMDVSGSFLGMALDVYMHSLVGTDVGIVAVVSMVGVIAAGALGMVYFVMRLVTHLAQHVPMWLGGTQGTDLGTDSAAQQAMQQSERGGLGSRALVGATAGAVMGTANAAGAARAGKAAQPEAKAGGDNQEMTTTAPAVRAPKYGDE